MNIKIQTSSIVHISAENPPNKHERQERLCQDEDPEERRRQVEGDVEPGQRPEDVHDGAGEGTDGPEPRADAGTIATEEVVTVTARRQGQDSRRRWRISFLDFWSFYRFFSHHSRKLKIKFNAHKILLLDSCHYMSLMSLRIIESHVESTLQCAPWLHIILYSVLREYS